MSYQLAAINIPPVDDILSVTVATASSAEQALPGKLGELLLMSSTTATYVKLGSTGMAAASSSNYSVLVPAGAMFLIRKRHTHVRAIRVTADGVLSFTRLGESH